VSFVGRNKGRRGVFNFRTRLRKKEWDESLFPMKPGKKKGGYPPHTPPRAVKARRGTFAGHAGKSRERTTSTKGPGDRYTCKKGERKAPLTLRRVGGGGWTPRELSGVEIYRKWRGTQISLKERNRNMQATKKVEGRKSEQFVRGRRPKKPPQRRGCVSYVGRVEKVEGQEMTYRKKGRE